MNLKNALENYEYFSGKLSDVARQLSFAGIAVVWIFVTRSETGEIHFSSEHTLPLLFFVVSLALDLLHYTSAAALWGFFHRYKEKSGISAKTEFGAPVQINHPALLFFWLKVLAVILGYVFLLTAFAC